MSLNPMQWQCGECGGWVDAGWSMHVHYATREPSLDEMVAARRMDEALPGSSNAFAPMETSLTTYFRDGGELTREKPL